MIAITTIPMIAVVSNEERLHEPLMIIGENSSKWVINAPRRALSFGSTSSDQERLAQTKMGAACCNSRDRLVQRSRISVITEYNKKGLNQASTVASDCGWRLFDRAIAPAGVLRNDERLAEAYSSAGCRDCWCRIVHATRRAVAALWNNELEPSEFLQPSKYPGHRVRSQGPLPLKETLTCDGPVDNFARWTPLFFGTKQRFSRCPRMTGLWPMDKTPAPTS